MWELIINVRAFIVSSFFVLTVSKLIFNLTITREEIQDEKI